MADSVLSSVLPNNSIRSLIPRNEESTVYADNESNLAQKEDVIPNNDTIMTFTNYTPGSNSVFRIGKSYQFLSQMFIRFEIDTTAAVTSASDYAAYNLLQTVKYQIGSCEQTILYPENMLDYIHELCEDNDEKKAHIHEAAGYKVLPAAAGAAKSTYIYAFLPLPWSSIKANKLGQNQKPFPIHALQDNIEIQIQMNDSTSMGGTIGSKILGASLMFKYFKIGNHQQLMKEKIRYPFKAPLNNQKFTVTAGANTFALTNFKKGECTDLLFHVSDTADRYRGCIMTNMVLSFNGVKIWNSNGSDRFWDILTSNQPSTYGIKRIKFDSNLAAAANVGTCLVDASGLLNVNVQAANNNFIEVNGYSDDVTAGAKGAELKNYYYVIPLGEIRAKLLESGNNYALSGDFSRQQLQLSFNSLVAGNLYVGYVFTGVYEIDEYGSAILAY